MSNTSVGSSASVTVKNYNTIAAPFYRDPSDPVQTSAINRALRTRYVKIVAAAGQCLNFCEVGGSLYLVVGGAPRRVGAVTPAEPAGGRFPPPLTTAPPFVASHPTGVRL